MIFLDFYYMKVLLLYPLMGEERIKWFFILYILFGANLGKYSFHIIIVDFDAEKHMRL